MRAVERPRSDSLPFGTSGDGAMGARTAKLHTSGWVVLIAAIGFAGCRPNDPPRRPEDTCAIACAARAPRCSHRECAQGCNFILDRLVEREGDRVVACVASGGPACDDAIWAACSVRIGVHADGGPPPPPAPKGEDEDDDR